MVGAGGIGCELLKNLVLTGFGEIHIVDMDTIDLSNLNRQFLFGMQHIKKPKALVAKETAGKLNPNVKLVAHHANIKDSNFNIKWFKGFSIVFDALDNLDARKHVNKMCLAADVPLIESGTQGYDGQVQIIKQGETECYECNPKAVPKSFPVCTIRSTPSQPIHCIVWAKSYLFAEVFGTSEERSPELDLSVDSENAKELINLKREAEELNNIREKIDSADFAESIFQKVFKRDIDRLRSMEDMWKSRTPPEPLEFTKLSGEAGDVMPEIAQDDQKLWSVVENYVVFADSIKRLASRIQELKSNARGGDTAPILSFDKDDVDTLDFVAASANLRSHIFGIDLKSKFDIKQMAGNIIPAIATTNAIIAGLCVLQAFKILRDDIKSGKMIFLAKYADRVLSAEILMPPKPSCGVCGVARTAVAANINEATLGDLVEKVLQKELGYGEDISILTNQLVYDVDFEDNLHTSLKQLGFEQETFITVVDEEDCEEVGPRFNLQMVVTHDESLGNDFILTSNKLDIPRKPRVIRRPPPVEDLSDFYGPAKHSIGNISDSESPVKKRKMQEEFKIVEDRPNKKRAVISEVNHLSLLDNNDDDFLNEDGRIIID